MDEDSQPRDLLSLTTEIVASFVGGNTVAASDVPTVITSVFQALRVAGQDKPDKARNPRCQRSRSRNLSAATT